MLKYYHPQPYIEETASLLEAVRQMMYLKCLLVVLLEILTEAYN
jgi:hypothetical protein